MADTTGGLLLSENLLQSSPRQPRRRRKCCCCRRPIWKLSTLVVIGLCVWLYLYVKKTQEYSLRYVKPPHPTPHPTHKQPTHPTPHPTHPLKPTKQPTRKPVAPTTKPTHDPHHKRFKSTCDDPSQTADFDQCVGTDRRYYYQNNITFITHVENCLVGDWAGQLTTEEVQYHENNHRRCEVPDDFPMAMAYDMLFMHRMEERIAYTLQCGIDRPIILRETSVRRRSHIGGGRHKIYEKGNTVIYMTDGILEAHVPLCYAQNQKQWEYMPVYMYWGSDEDTLVIAAQMKKLAVNFEVTGSSIEIVETIGKRQIKKVYKSDIYLECDANGFMDVTGTKLTMTYPDALNRIAVQANDVKVNLTASYLNSTLVSVNIGSSTNQKERQKIEDALQNSEKFMEAMLSAFNNGMPEDDELIAEQIQWATNTGLKSWQMEMFCDYLDSWFNDPCDQSVMKHLLRKIHLFLWIQVIIVVLIVVYVLYTFGMLFCCFCRRCLGCYCCGQKKRNYGETTLINEAGETNDVTAMWHSPLYDSDMARCCYCCPSTSASPRAVHSGATYARGVGEAGMGGSYSANHGHTRRVSTHAI